MATKSLTDDEEKQGVSNAAGTTLDGAGTGGGSQTGTNWTNLSQYLDNNKGAGAGIANGITKLAQDNVNQIEGAGGAVDAWATGAKKQVDDSTRQDKYFNTLTAGTDKDVAGIDQDGYKSWTKLKNYWGDVKDPSQSTGYDQTYSAVNNTKDQIKNLSSYDGQKAALQNTYGTDGKYSTGFQKLDAFALNGDKSGQQKLQDFQTNNANFGQKFDTAATGVKSYIDGADARGQGALDKTNKAVNDRYTSTYGKGEAAQTADSDAIYLDDMKSANLKSPGDNSFTGLTGSQYVTRNRGDAQAYLDPDGLAALNKLSTIDNSDDTNEVGAGNKATSGLNWQALAQYIPSIGPGSLAPGSKTSYDPPARPFTDESGYTPGEKPYNKQMLRPARR